MRLSTALITDSLLIAGDVVENVKRSPSIKLSPPSASVNFAVSPVVACSGNLNLDKLSAFCFRQNICFCGSSTNSSV